MNTFRLAHALALLGLVAAVLAAQPVELEFEFVRYNGVYENLEAEVEPIESGPVTIRLRSPEHRLELLSHLVRLSKDPEGLHDLGMMARFGGTGSLVAELDFGGVPVSLSDQVEFPVQQVEVQAKVAIDTIEEGYRFTAEKLPRFVEVEMTSRLGQELVTWCERIALFVAGNAGCAELEARISRPRLPLPAPGASYVVKSEHLTPEERARIDLYLEDL